MEVDPMKRQDWEEKAAAIRASVLALKKRALADA
jgi:hypothetical protein